MAEKNHIDIQKVIEQGAKVASLQDLQQKGYQKVKVLDEATILNLITQAVDRVVNAQTADERERVAAQSRQEFDRLMKEQRDMKSRAQLLETSKNELIERVESLQKELSIAMDVQQDTIHKKVQEITASLRKHADEANKRHQSAQQALTESCVEVDRLKSEQARLNKELADSRRAADELRKNLDNEIKRANEMEEVNADIDARLEAALGDLEKTRSEHQGKDQEHAGMKDAVLSKDQEIEALRQQSEKEQEKSHAAESKLSNMQWQVKEAQEKMEAGLKEAKQARDDCDRMNSHNIRLMSEVQGLRAEVSKLKAGGAAPAPGSAPAPAHALAQLGTDKGGSYAGKWKFMVAKIPPVPAPGGGKSKEPAAAPIDLPAGGDWDLVTVVREPDGSCLCFFRSPR